MLSLIGCREPGACQKRRPPRANVEPAADDFGLGRPVAGLGRVREGPQLPPAVVHLHDEAGARDEARDGLEAEQAREAADGPTSNGAVRERVEPAHLGGRWFGADGPPSPDSITLAQGSTTLS